MGSSYCSLEMKGYRLFGIKRKVFDHEALHKSSRLKEIKKKNNNSTSNEVTLKFLKFRIFNRRFQSNDNLMLFS